MPTGYLIHGSNSGLRTLSLSGALAAPLPPIHLNGVGSIDLDYGRGKYYMTQAVPSAIYSLVWDKDGISDKQNLTNGGTGHLPAVMMS